MKLMLHICCGPCSLYVIDNLKSRGIDDITGFFFNPNIHPYDELIRRWKSAQIAANVKEIPLISFFNYDLAKWKSFDGISADRCRMCYRTRFEATAKYASENGFTHFSSTLFVSPYQNHEVMTEEALRAAKIYGIEFLDNSDYREGFYDGQKQARDLGLYRQKYCGCIKSLLGN